MSKFSRDRILMSESQSGSASMRCVFAGRVVEIGDDPSSGCTTVECEHVLDYVKRAVIGPDWTARIKEGMYLTAGMTFTLSDSSDGGTTSSAGTTLTVVGSGATAPYEMNAGLYNHDEICTAINAWTSQARSDGDITGAYHIGLGPYGTATGPTRTYWSYRISGTGPTVLFQFTYPKVVSQFFGDLDDSSSSSSVARLYNEVGAVDGVDYDRVSERVPPRNGFIPPGVSQLSLFEVEDERGEFVDQRGDLPAEVDQTSGASDVGLIVINGQAIFGVQKIGGQLSAAVPITSITMTGQQREFLVDDGGAR